MFLFCCILMSATAARNLFYIEYLKTNPVITCEAFEKLWSGLSKDEVKVRVTLMA